MSTEFLSTRELQSQQRLRRNAVLILMLATVALIFGVMVTLSFVAPKLAPPTLLLIGGGLMICLTVPVIIWNYPRGGLFFLFFCTTLFDMDPRAQNAHKITSGVPIFLNFNNIGEVFGIGGLSPFKFSPAEIVIVLALVSWLIRSIVKRDMRIERGPFLPVLVFYAITTAIGYIHGFVSGGDPTMALWEVRAQFYPIIMYFLALNMITDRKQVEHLLWLAFIGFGLLSIVGVISFFQLGGHVGEQGILDHEDSLVLNVPIFLLLFLRLNNGNRKMTRLGFLILPTVVFVMLENQRRAGIAAFVIGFIASLPMMWVIFVERRRQISAFIGMFLVVSAVYLPVAWNASGVWALPARAIRSSSSPDWRDQSSDNYRFAENFDLQYTRDLSPWYGYGYGKPFLQPQPLPAVTTDFLKYFAHNSVMWVWMRTGHLGFFAFLLMIATVCIRGLQICREETDPVLLAAGLMGVIFLLMSYIYGKYDLQLTNYRTMMHLGFWLGLLGALPKLRKAAQILPPQPAWTEAHEDEEGEPLPALAGGWQR